MTVTVPRLLPTGVLTGMLAGGLAMPAMALGHDLASPTVTIVGGVTTMELTATQTGSMFIQKGGSPTAQFPTEAPGVGDAVSFEESLYQGATLIGTDKGVCTFESFGTAACKVIVTLADGTLNVAGRVAEDAEGPNAFELISGSGAYEGVDGGASVVDVDDTHSSITLRYTVPGSGPDPVPEPVAAAQVQVVPVGGAAAGGGQRAGSTDGGLLIGVGIAAVAGSIGLFAAAQAAARRN
ncbi:hypothetical protein [Sporichthya sp.]|uniref:hypothetical protein n=1 Tax=Sporichthya sp. TaxID=65475 RepID=UPI001802F5EB|nr:hypothetical protein [Sporichthya sp.]MBA3744275.1 hypothetical protein [Sporichthya sp.]